MSAEQQARSGETGGQFLRRLRKERELTPEALAASVGVTRITVDRWEKDERTPQRSRRQRLADVLSISESELLDGLHLVARGGSSASNVVHLRPPADAAPDPDGTPGDDYTEDQRRFLDIALAALETERACNPTWLAAAAATARTIKLDWAPAPVQGESHLG